MKKLNFRWSKVIKLDESFRSCFILGGFSEDNRRPYSGDDEENDLDKGGQHLILFSINLIVAHLILPIQHQINFLKKLYFLYKT